MHGCKQTQVKQKSQKEHCNLFFLLNEHKLLPYSPSLLLEKPSIRVTNFPTLRNVGIVKVCTETEYKFNLTQVFCYNHITVNCAIKLFAANGASHLTLLIAC